VDYVEGVPAQAFAPADFVAWTMPRPLAEGFGFSPSAHAHPDLRDHDQHAQYVQAYDASQIHAANVRQFNGQVSLETRSRLEFLESFLSFGFGLRRWWIFRALCLHHSGRINHHFGQHFLQLPITDFHLLE